MKYYVAADKTMFDALKTEAQKWGKVVKEEKGMFEGILIVESKKAGFQEWARMVSKNIGYVVVNPVSDEQAQLLVA